MIEIHFYEFAGQKVPVSVSYNGRVIATREQLEPIDAEDFLDFCLWLKKNVHLLRCIHDKKSHRVARKLYMAYTSPKHYQRILASCRTGCKRSYYPARSIAYALSDLAKERIVGYASYDNRAVIYQYDLRALLYRRYKRYLFIVVSTRYDLGRVLYFVDRNYTFGQIAKMLNDEIYEYEGGLKILGWVYKLEEFIRDFLKTVKGKLCAQAQDMVKYLSLWLLAQSVS